MFNDIDKKKFLGKLKNIKKYIDIRLLKRINLQLKSLRKVINYITIFFIK